MDEQRLSHRKWKCQNYNVIVPKYRRKAVYGKLRKISCDIEKAK